jgi:hypothetical protein
VAGEHIITQRINATDHLDAVNGDEGAGAL